MRLVGTVLLSIAASVLLGGIASVTALRRTPVFAASQDQSGRRTQSESESGGAKKSFHHDYNGKKKKPKEELPTAKEHLVESIPYLPEGAFPTRHYAGHMPASPGTDKRLFYWLFEPPSEKEDAPLILWLNGGPGCSSMDGLWIENGPFLLRPNGSGSWTIDVHEYSWHTLPAWLLYVDQPVGTGLSFTREKNYCKNDLEVNTDFHYFLRQFFTVYGDMLGVEPDANNANLQRVTRPFYFSGESHAGHYIPSMMDYILRKNDEYMTGTTNDQDKGPKIIIPLAGAAIGNGWVDPYYQYAAAEAAYGMSLIDGAQKVHMDKLEDSCRSLLEKGRYHENVCFHLLDFIIAESFGHSAPWKVSQYDNRKVESRYGARQFPPGHVTVEAYLSGHGVSVSPPMTDISVDSVLEALHATESIQAEQEYKECTDPPYYALSHQDGKGVVTELVRVLEHPTRPKILFFNGMNDLICNHVGNEAFLAHLPWKGRHEWVLAQRFTWTGGNATPLDLQGNPVPIAGYVKRHDNLAFLKVLESGHMVPMDQPAVSLEMMRILVHDFESGFASSPQRTSRADEGTPDACPTCASCSAVTTTTLKLAGTAARTGPWLWVSVAMGGCFLLLAGIFYTLCSRKRRSERRNDGEIALVEYRDYVDDDDDEYEEVEEEAE